jgi:hypothetical protein
VQLPLIVSSLRQPAAKLLKPARNCSYWREPRGWCFNCDGGQGRAHDRRRRDSAQHVAQQRNAVEGKHVERMAQFGQGALDMRQGHDGEPGEAPVVRRDLRGRRLVDEPGQAIGKRLVPEGHTGRREREDRGVDGVRIHERQGAVR